MKRALALSLLLLVGCLPGWLLDDTINKPLGWKLNEPPSQKTSDAEKVVCHCVRDDAGTCDGPNGCGRPECGWCSNEH